MARIINTSKEDRHPEWRGGRNPRAIEAQEGRGQRQILEDTVLPAACEGRDLLIRAGVVFGPPVPDDPLFVEATLPEGWYKRATGDTSLWSELVDAPGVVRAKIFYKAAFYDRDAFMVACRPEPPAVFNPVPLHTDTSGLEEKGQGV